MNSERLRKSFLLVKNRTNYALVGAYCGFRPKRNAHQELTKFRELIKQGTNLYNTQGGVVRQIGN